MGPQAGPGGGQVDGDRGGANAAVDAPGDDDEAGVSSGGGWLGGEGDPFELTREVGGPVGPGEQAARPRRRGRLSMTSAGRSVVADGDDWDPAVHRRGWPGAPAADQNDRHHRPGGQAGRARSAITTCQPVCPGSRPHGAGNRRFQGSSCR